MTRHRARAAERGLTLIELVVVMGVLGMLFMFLMMVINDTVRLWTLGEERADLESRAHHALDAVTEDLGRVAGLEAQVWSTGREDRFARASSREGAPSSYGRFVVDYVPITAEGRTVPAESQAEKPEALDWYPRLRFVMRLGEVESVERDRARLREAILAEQGSLDPSELERRVRAALVGQEAARIGEALLRVRPTGEAGGSYLALYRDVRPLQDATNGRWVDGAELPELGEPIVHDLLYVGIRLRSQFTRSFAEPVLSEHGPELCWDSARAGLFDPRHPVLRFSLDLDPQSAADPLDDIMPSAYELTVVVDSGPGRELVALLREGIDAKELDIRVDYPERLPDRDVNHIKIGSEWIRFSGIAKDRLLGVQRAQRGTAAREHAAGARIHSGREAVLRVPIAVAREYWNG